MCEIGLGSYVITDFNQNGMRVELSLSFAEGKKWVLLYLANARSRKGLPALADPRGLTICV